MKEAVGLTCVDMSGVYALRQTPNEAAGLGWAGLGSLSVMLVDSGQRDEERMSGEPHKPSGSGAQPGALASPHSTAQRRAAAQPAPGRHQASEEPDPWNKGWQQWKKRRRRGKEREN